MMMLLLWSLMFDVTAGDARLLNLLCEVDGSEAVD